MTTQLTSYFNQAQLSVAAYADLSGVSDATVAVERLLEAGMSEAQAQLFLGIDENGDIDPFKGYEVLSHLPNTDSGFSASIFRNKETSEITFAMRGTEFSFSFETVDDLLRTDFADIGFDGIALKQTIDLFNYYQELIASSGENYSKYIYNEQILDNDGNIIQPVSISSIQTQAINDGVLIISRVRYTLINHQKKVPKYERSARVYSID